MTSRREALEKAVADAEKRLHTLAVGIETAAKSSATLSGAERDAKRMAEWVDAKTRDLRESLQKLEVDAKAVEHTIAAHAKRFSNDLETRSAAVHGLRLDLKHLRTRIGAVRQGKHAKAEQDKARPARGT